ncbi:hypothetical protein [Streptomyces sp. NPDC101393]|uniref:hypothetical protein n=1 Tax=Streptomyces sp. NPDC101393 TaxID=3366141 RepID=UPI00382C8380
MFVDIRQDAAPALGDVRALGEGDHIYVFKDAKQRKDWTRYAVAIGHAVCNGASVSWLEGER